MPRYFFDVKNGHRLIDPAGIDCASDDEAKKQAKAIATQIATDAPASASRRVAVVDDEGREIAAISVKDSAS
jgi:hypothetical protein